MSGPEIVVPVGFSPIGPSILVPSTGPWARRFARVIMPTMAGLVSWACSQISPKCWAVLAAAATPWRETSSGPRWSVLPSKQCGSTSTAKDPVWSLNTEKSGAHPLSGTECTSMRPRPTRAASASGFRPFLVGGAPHGYRRRAPQRSPRREAGTLGAHSSTQVASRMWVSATSRPRARRAGMPP